LGEVSGFEVLGGSKWFWIVEYETCYYGCDHVLGCDKVVACVKMQGAGSLCTRLLYVR
jgi:hypothetical protein